MERKEENEDTVTNIKFENSIFDKCEFIKKEPAPVYQDTYIEDYGHGGSEISLDQIKTEKSGENMTLEQKEDDLVGFQYSNSDFDNLKQEHSNKGSQSSDHDSFKNEIKEEPNRECTHDALDDSELNEYSLKIEIEEDEVKLMPYEEKQTNEKDSFKNEIKEEPNRECTHDALDDSELNEYSLKIEIEEDEVKLMPYEEKQTNEKDSFKNEIKEEPNRECTHDALDDSELNEYSLKIEIEEDEVKLMPYEEKQTIEKDIAQKKETLEIIKKIEVHSSNKEQHTSRPAEEKTLKCQICLKKFSVVQNLKRHIRTHTGEKPYECQICFKEFSEAANLKRHIRTHTGEKPYKCEICFKKLTTAAHLQYHMRTHTGEKPYKCEICFKQFTQSGALKHHIRSHTGEKPYTCEICFTPFSISQNLKIHIRTHTGEKPYKCEICFKEFTQSGALKRHIRSHTGEKSYKC
ncbi:uncharacterized protein [Diabrotica undecimpunctata]|uniref:uncharacterized protein isoform X10 n=1 Tax=Diabrotica undecimpunctata TaxID=50387 RepID=UPI003B63A953